MQFDQSKIPGVVVINLETRGDERGFFARTYCHDEFRSAGCQVEFVQANTSWSANKGTLRGMHYQLAPAAEVKVLRCIRGAIWDVALDLRPKSPTFGQHFGIELSAENRTMLHVPEGCAHGFLTLVDDTEVTYMVSSPYTPDKERGVRWDDPAFGIEWPIKPTVLSDKDKNQRDFDPVWHLGEDG